MSCMISEISPISGGRLTSTLNASIQQLELREPPMTLTNGTMLMVTYENDGRETGPDVFGDPDGEGRRELVPSAEAEPGGNLRRPLLTGPDEGEEQESDVKDLSSFRAGAVEGERDLFDLLWALEAQGILTRQQASCLLEKANEEDDKLMEAHTMLNEVPSKERSDELLHEFAEFLVSYAQSL
ncbi:hypothetical protein GUITHDRAFT_114429 [Guillardia theta CCMP2712]|uniref:Uncharacterized protein n=1 Tax=Guillardia theta (strain CCMP2712) TaxID=905079 RepID=L1ITN8_GUITC|nr:hypothetical protein GUITHDRAFT_114429 [Guillardia theta CCMP2712]EKX39467.1 hypothetical protein GUITHDRAFT_114429 [Guillardia theta CCMP2712]|eukprot:XP_005826447.1 hypothetical protein GUITHDRAFT_114429 [Guillardia theta CCMP2712]